MSKRNKNSAPKQTAEDRKPLRAKKRRERAVSQTISPFSGLEVKRGLIKPARVGLPKQTITIKITDPEAFERDLKLQQKLAAMVNPKPTTLESYLSSMDPSDAIRQARKEFLQLLFQIPTSPDETTRAMSLESAEARAFIEVGLPVSESERLEIAKASLFQSILLVARLPLDPREEMNQIIRALEEVKKTLPKRKTGPKEDKLIAEAAKKRDQGMTPRAAYKWYMNELGYKDVFYDSDYQVWCARIRNKRSEERKKRVA